MKKLSYQKIGLIFLLSMLILSLEAQNKKGLLLELSGTPILTSFEAKKRSVSFDLALVYFVSSKANIRLQFNETFNQNSETETYDALSGIGLGGGYIFFEGKEGSFWEDGTFEILANAGGGFSNFHEDKTFFYYDISCRGYISKTRFVGLGFNHKLYENKKDNTNGMYVNFGFRFYYLNSARNLSIASTNRFKSAALLS